MTTLDWHTEYARALHLFGGDTPSAHLEQELLDAFNQRPQAVANAITKIGKAYANGKIHSPWGALKAEIPKQLEHNQQPNAGAERERRIRNAEQWLRNAGLHYPTWNETHDELYHERGTLHAYRDDHKLEQHLAELWDELHPLSIIADQDHENRLAAWRKQINALPPKPEGGRNTDDLRKLAQLKSLQPLPGDHHTPTT